MLSADRAFCALRTHRQSEYHNLHEMPDRKSYDDCIFGAATKLADAAPNPGVDVSLTAEGTRYFACSKICSSNGHKVKVCVEGGNKTATCDCPEGTLESGVVSRAANMPRQPSLWIGSAVACICTLLMCTILAQR